MGGTQYRNAYIDLLHCTVIILLFNASAVIGLSVLKLEPQEEGTFPVQTDVIPSTSNIPDIQYRLSQLFLKCSTECAGLSDCLGITIYKLQGDQDQGENSQNSFTCAPTLNDVENESSSNLGKVFYKVMFRDKLPKVQRRNFLVRNFRSVSSVDSAQNILQNNFDAVGKRDTSPSVESAKSTVARKVGPVKIDPLFTETATKAGVTVDAQNMTIADTDPLFGKNEPPSTTFLSQIPNTTTISPATTTPGDFESVFSNEASHSNTSENSHGESNEVTTVKSSDIAPVKIDPLFTETSTAAGVTVAAQNMTIAVTESLFGKNEPPSTTIASEASNESMINGPTTTIPIVTTTLGDFESIFANETSKHKESEGESGESKEVTTVKPSNIAPVKIDPLFTETTTVSGSEVKGHSENSTISVDPLFESATNSSCNCSDTTPSLPENKEAVYNGETSQNSSASENEKVSETPPTHVSAAISEITSVSAPKKVSGNSQAHVTEAVLETTTVSHGTEIVAATAGPAIANVSSENNSEEAPFSTTPKNGPLEAVTSSQEILPAPTQNETISAENIISAFTPTRPSISNLENTSENTTSITVTTTVSNTMTTNTVSENSTASSSEMHANPTTLATIPITTSSPLETKMTVFPILKVTSTTVIPSLDSSTGKSENSLSTTEPSSVKNPTTPAGDKQNIPVTTIQSLTSDTSSPGIEHLVTDIPNITLDEPTVEIENATQKPIAHNNTETSTILPDKESESHTLPSTSTTTEILSQSQLLKTLTDNNNNSHSEHPEGVHNEVSIIFPEKNETTSNAEAGVSTENILATTTPGVLSETETTPISQGSSTSTTLNGESTTESYSESSTENFISHKVVISIKANNGDPLHVHIHEHIKSSINEGESSNATERPSTSDQTSISHVETSTSISYEVSSEESASTSRPQRPAGSQSKDTECLFQDTERYLRNIRGTAFALIDDQPAMLSFVSGVQSHCVGILMKNGTRGMRHIESIIPGFPSGVEVDAAGYLNDRIYVIDSSKDQNIWSFRYDFTTRRYSEVPSMNTKQEFFDLCQISSVKASEVRVKAFVQVSLQDSSCIIFDESRKPTLSDNASDDAKSLAKAITFLLETAFLNYAESVFAWLDETFISSVYVYASDGDLYRLYRNETTNLKWTSGNYEVMPYPQLPLKP